MNKTGVIFGNILGFVISGMLMFAVIWLLVLVNIWQKDNCINNNGMVVDDGFGHFDKCIYGSDKK